MACMAVMRIDHPDIEEFITAKNPVNALRKQLGTQYNPCSYEDAERIWNEIKAAAINGTITTEQTKLASLAESYLSNFNISVGVTGEFMKALNNNANFDLVFEGKVYKTVKAVDLWDLIVKNAHASGDPGLLFLDVVNDKTPYKYSGQTLKATNPCGFSYVK